MHSDDTLDGTPLAQMTSLCDHRRPAPALAPDRVFDSDQVPVRDRFELSRQFLASSYRLEPMATGTLRTNAKVICMEGVRLTDGFLSGGAMRRKADEDTAQAEEQVSLFLTISGRWRGDAGRHAKDVESGQLVFLDRSQGLGGVVEDLSSITLVLAKRALLEALPGVESMHGETLAGPMAGLLTDQLISGSKHAGQLAASERLSVGRMMSALAIGALARGSGEPAGLIRPALKQVLVERAKLYIRAHCRDPRLSPSSVANRLGVSRAMLYRAFEESGGVAQLIRQSRLEAARLALQDPSDLRRIGEIAFAHGFGGEAQFSRAFRHAFGMSPREIRSLAARVEPNPS